MAIKFTEKQKKQIKNKTKKLLELCIEVSEKGMYDCNFHTMGFLGTIDLNIYDRNDLENERLNISVHRTIYSNRTHLNNYGYIDSYKKVSSQLDEVIKQLEGLK